jgi:hypothetical protein
MEDEEMINQTVMSALSSRTHVPLLGKVVAWSIGHVALTRDELIRRVRESGLDERYIPKAIRARTCMVRTLKTLEEEGFLRRILEEPERAVFVLVGEEVDAQRLDVRFSVETTFTFDKQSKQLTCDDPTTQARVDALMSHFASAFLPDDIRRFLLDTIKQGAGALTLRDRGGVYLVPAPKFMVVSALESFVQSLGPTCSLMVLNIPETQSDTSQVFKAFESEFLDEMEALGRELSDLETEGDKVRTSTWLKRLQDFQGLRGKAQMFADLLSVESSRYTARISELETRVRSQLIG